MVCLFNKPRDYHVHDPNSCKTTWTTEITTKRGGQCDWFRQRALSGRQEELSSDGGVHHRVSALHFTRSSAYITCCFPGHYNKWIHHWQEYNRKFKKTIYGRFFFFWAKYVMFKLGVWDQIKLNGIYKIWTFFILSSNPYFIKD